ncbi:uncharacterized protein [Nicotiana sylvestris]|uniref:uncharacterized protein n=1 Tax=Nicotiana sylvestris TaxID=4096 RepID=UPI00388CCE49
MQTDSYKGESGEFPRHEARADKVYSTFRGFQDIPFIVFSAVQIDCFLTRLFDNGSLIIPVSELREYVVEVRRVNDRLMIIKLVVGEIVRQVPPAEKLFIGGDFNSHIGSIIGGYGEVHGGFDFGERNGGGTSLLDFAKAFRLVIANSSFLKREEHLVNFQNVVVKTQIDFLLGRCDIRLCKDCKVIPGEILAMQHRLLVMDVGVRLKRRKRSARGRPKIRWGALTKYKAQELEW